MAKYRKKPPKPLNETQRSEIDAFFSKHSRYLFYIARLLTASASDEEDLIQESLLRVMMNAELFLSLPEAKQKAYITKAMIHLFVDDFRQSQKLPETQCSDKLRQQLCAMNRMVPGSDTHLEILDLATKLPERDWYLLQQLYLEGASCEDIADKLGCSTESIRSMASRARIAAKKVLEQSRDKREKSYE